VTDIIAIIDAQRKQRGFLSIAFLLEHYSKNVILDPFSTLISENVEMGQDNSIYPNVIIEAKNGGSIWLGNGNILFPGTLFLADQGEIRIGNNNEFGDGGLRLKANMVGATITIGDFGRYTNGAEIMGKCVLGSGSQILGQITVQNCNLGSGEGYKGSDPDLRGGLLKGFGLARSLDVKQGEVINGQGTFAQANIERQASYHPPKKST
jgi:carbonic anhydrase/acetyltransferase-like protein (isoleucine patch superfamily)